MIEPTSDQRYLSGLLGSAGLQSDIAQLRAKSVLAELHMPVTDVAWRYVAAQVVRNLSGGLLALERVAEEPTQLVDVVPAAKRMAEAWEALALLEEGTSVRTALLNAAAAYELAGYQANSACLARKGLPNPFATTSPLLFAEVGFLFLQRYLVSLRTRISPSPSRPVEHQASVGDLVDVTAQALGTAALARASLYFLRGDEIQLQDAERLLDLAREGFAAAGDVPNANLSSIFRRLLPVMRERSTWHLLSSLRPDDSRWSRYLTLLARGPGRNIARTASVSELWPSQIAALNSGLLSSRNSKVVRMPTSAGKTRVAELAIAHTLVDDVGSKVIYIAPYRALVGEVEESLRAVISDLGYQVSTVLGTYDSDALEELIAAEADLLVVTPEKLDLLLRASSDSLSDVRLIIIDEGHLVSDLSRGIKFEWLVTRLRRRLPAARFIFLSAVVPQESLADFAVWLKADRSDVITSDWRPATIRVAMFEWRQDRGFLTYEPTDDTAILRQFVPAVVRVEDYEIVSPASGRILHRRFPDTTSKSHTAAELAIKFSEIGSVLIFCPQRNLAEAVGRALETRLEYELVSRGLPNYLQTFNPRAVAIVEEWLGSGHLVARLLRRGIALHHGRLPDAVRKVIEQEVRSRRARILVATNTLAQGVNLPIRTVIVHSCRRRADGVSQRISTRDYWNIAGRAGRAREETDGTVIHIVRTPQDRADYQYFQRTRSSLSPVRSAMLQILEAIADKRLSDAALAEVLDPEVLALMVEEDPEELLAGGLSEFLRDTLAGIQDASDGTNLQRLESIVSETVEGIEDRIPDSSVRRVYSETGLSSTSAEQLREYCETNWRHLTPLLLDRSQDRLADLAVLALDVCDGLQEMQPDSSFGGSYQELLQAWMAGTSMTALMDRFAPDVTGREELGRFIDEYFGYLIPWGFSAFLRIAGKVLDFGDQRFPDSVAFLPSMIKLGLPAPEAVWAMVTGINSRQAALRIAAEYVRSNTNREFSTFAQWARQLDPESLPDLDAAAAEEISVAFAEAGRNVLLTRLPAVVHLPFRASVIGLRWHGEPGAFAAVRLGATLDVSRDYDNLVDRNAILLSFGGQPLGYLARPVAQWLAPEVDAGLDLRCLVTHIGPNSVGVELAAGG
jgi:helicase